MWVVVNNHDGFITVSLSDNYWAAIRIAQEIAARDCHDPADIIEHQHPDYEYYLDYDQAETGYVYVIWADVEVEEN